MIQSVPVVPTLTSMAFAPLIIRAYPAVPEATAVTDHVPCLAIDPPDAAAHGDDGNVIVANRVPDAALLALAGCDPVLIWMVLPAGKLVEICVASAFLMSVSNRTAILLVVK
jgi:hypothetical protein